MTLFMALETEPKTTIPRATRVRFQAPTVSLRLIRRLLLLLLLHEVDNLVHSSCILLEELYEFAILALRRLLYNSNRPTIATTQFGLIYCLDLQSATDCYIERLRTTLSEFYLYFSILQRIDKLVLSETILLSGHCAWIGSADESSQRTGEIWQLLVRLAMPSTEFSFVRIFRKAAPRILTARNCAFRPSLQPLIIAQSSKWDIHESQSLLSNAANDSGITTGLFCNTEADVPCLKGWHYHFR